MSFAISTDIVCDSCSQWVHGATGVKPCRKEAKSIARAAGWFITDKEHLCPDCLQNLKMTTSKVLRYE